MDKYLPRPRTSLIGLNEAQIKILEDEYKASFVGDFCVKGTNGWVNAPIAVFYQENIPEEVVAASHYFGIYFQGHQLYICNAASAFDDPITGIVAMNGEIIYSRYRHDGRYSQDGSVFIDGGRDYIRSSGGGQWVTLTIDKDKLRVMTEEEKGEFKMSKILAVVEQTIQNKINKKEEFTGHDITKEVRQALPNFNVDHQTVNGHVKQFYTTGRMAGYLTTVVAKANGATPITYAPAPAPDNGTTTVTDDDEEAELETVTRKTLDKGGRLLIPVNFLQQIGLEPNDTAWVYGQGDKIFISGETLGLTYDLITQYTVDKSGNIRIRSGNLKYIGFNPLVDTSLKIESNNDTVIISKA